MAASARTEASKAARKRWTKFMTQAKKAFAQLDRFRRL
jgi:hypothetical protein